MSIFMIHFYQATLGYFFGGSCRYYPSCSNYAVEAYQKFSFFKASVLVFKRVSSCHPLSRKQFYNPVPSMLHRNESL